MPGTASLGRGLLCICYARHEPLTGSKPHTFGVTRDAAKGLKAVRAWLAEAVVMVCMIPLTEKGCGLPEGRYCLQKSKVDPRVQMGR